MADPQALGKHRAFCLAEDRGGAEIGIKFAILSLREHCPEAHVFLYRPNPIPEFREWLRPHSEMVTLIDHWPAGAQGWNCKPHTLLPILREGWREVVWLDSDAILSASVSALLDSLKDDEIVVAEEAASQPDKGTELRTRGWNFAVGRSIPCTLNSSFLRVTARHEPLLSRWQECLESEEYHRYDGCPLMERPPHARSDQDVLNALLGSAEFAHHPVRLLHTGRDIIHCGGALGYGLGERLRGIFGPSPMVLHAIGGKPWVMLGPGCPDKGWFGMLRRLMQELSPYVAAVRKYREAVQEPCPWLDYHTAPGIVLRVLGLGNHALRGLPVTVLATMWSMFRRSPA
ncbi:MAG TPA: hypothetical protein VGH19_21290 [Verrucomicrobiae bacterium]